jgi:hypothetical protein
MNIKKLLTLAALATGLTNLAIHCGSEGKETTARRHNEHPGHHGPHDGHGRHHMHDRPMVKYHLKDGSQEAGKLDVFNKETKDWDVYTLSSEASPIIEKSVAHLHQNRHEEKYGQKARNKSTKPHHNHVKSRKDAQGNIVLDVYENDQWVVYKK